MSKVAMIGIPLSIVALLFSGIPLPFEGPFLLPLVIVVAAFLFIPTRPALLLILGYGAFSGWAKLASQWNPLIYIAIDILLATVLIRWLASALPERRNLLQGVPFAAPLMAFIVLCLILMFSPLTHPILALGGVKAYVIPIVVYFLAYQVFVTPDQIRHALLALSIPAFFVAVYTFIQLSSGLSELRILYSPGELASKFQGTIQVDAGTGDLVFRPFSTLQDAGTAAHFNLISFFLAVAIMSTLAGNKDTQNRWSLIAFPLAFLSSAAVVISAVRIAWTGLIIGLVYVVWLGRGRSLKLMPLVAIAVVAGFLFAGDTYLGRDLFRRAQTMTTPVETFEQDRAFGWWYNNMWMVENTPLGVGMGKASPGLGGIEKFVAVDRGFWLPPPDNLVGALLIEVGVPGMLLLLGIVVSILVRATVLVGGLTDTSRSLATGLTGMVLAIFIAGIAGAGLFSTPVNLYFWVLSAFLMRLCSAAAPAPSPVLVPRAVPAAAFATPPYRPRVANFVRRAAPLAPGPGLADPVPGPPD